MKVAIIGGIGSGKSTVLQIIKDFGFHTISADSINSRLLLDYEYIKLIEKSFPTVVENNAINKDKLREIIFSNKTERLKLNSISFPFIKKELMKNTEKLAFVEVPLIAECECSDKFDELIFVSSTLKNRLKRLRNRPHISPLAKKIITAQLPVRKLKNYATITVFNNSTADDLKCSIACALNYIFEKHKLDYELNV